MNFLQLRNVVCLLVAQVLFFSTQYVAAEGPLISLERSWGLVLVDQGQGYESAHDGMFLSQSDRLLTMESSGGIVVSEGGCVIKLVENSVLALDSIGGCEEKEAAFRPAGPYYAAAIGIVKPKTTSDVEPSPEKAAAENSTPIAPVVQKASAEPVVENKNSSGGISKRTIAIGAGVAALLAAVGGGGGGGSSSTPQH